MVSLQGSKTIAIVGGGFTGAAVAYHLAQSDVGARIVVFEPRLHLGGGVAYDTRDGAHRINVPAARMSLIPGDDGHFARWIADSAAISDDPGAIGPDGNLYPRREVFGRYVADQLAAFLAAGQVTHVRDSVVTIARGTGQWALGGQSGREEKADIVILATTHPAPMVPALLENALGDDPRLIRDPCADDALSAVAPDARVLIVGTGLTMADIVASLDARGHGGAITALSRRGLLSRGHPVRPAPQFGSFADRHQTALSLLRDIRGTIATAAEQGVSWHGVIDAVRAQGQTFWPNLALAEQRRIVRHLRPFWDVHRFRIAPQVEQVLHRRLRDGTLQVFAASLRRATAGPRSIVVEFKRRGRPATQHLSFDVIVVTTGPAHHQAVATQPHLAGLARAGIIRADGVGLGIACDRRGRAVDRDGLPVASLFIAGPLARGTFGELMGLPQVSDYARFIAGQAHELLNAWSNATTRPRS
jgi:uncharacterized NAD(P)/FAD-binding protein YdhS